MSHTGVSAKVLCLAHEKCTRSVSLLVPERDEFPVDHVLALGGCRLSLARARGRLTNSCSRAEPRASTWARCAWLVLCLGFACGWSSSVSAQPLALRGHWTRAPESFVYDKQALSEALADPALAATSELAPSGGHYFFQAEFDVPRAGMYVIDFENSSVIGQFHHYLFDTQGQLLSERVGGIESAAENPFFLRHGRDVSLAAGRHRLISELRSPFFLGQPAPFVEALSSYRQAIKPGNALTLLCLGLFMGLGVYYAALAFWRRRVADGMYAFFILGNLLYNGSALLLFPDLFGIHWFYLISIPILFSNMSYVVFVLALLEIRPRTHPRLYRLALVLLLVMASFCLASAFVPHWSLEFDRYGVALFVGFGLIAALVRAREGSTSARVYLGAIGVFAALALSAISLHRLDAHMLYIEHIGLLAVAVEVSLLALVLAHQFAQLYSERETAVRRAKESIAIAHSDALTGLPNRYQLEAELLKLPAQGSLTFIDLDGLKHYNDEFGHQRGDELLCNFAQHISRRIGQLGFVHRLSGDEFAITCESGDVDSVAQQLEAALQDVRSDGFELAGASFGSVHVYENPTRDRLKHMADTRMYDQKRERRKSLPAERQRRRA
jgi:diguanylate cyclase